MENKQNNPMGTDGFEFVEFCGPDPKAIAADFISLGFTLQAKHRSKNISLYRQNTILFILNDDPSYAKNFGKNHGASACGMGFRVKDADFAYKRAISLGAISRESSLGVPAIEGVGGSLIHFVDRYTDSTIYDNDFEFYKDTRECFGAGLTYIDHLTHNVHRGEMNKLAGFYERLFNFREIRYFDIKGKVTGLVSRALTSPCNKIRIPINESSDDQSQIEEFLREFNGEGIQHIALGTDNIYHSVETLRKQSIKFLDVPDTYYEAVNTRVPWHSEDLKHLQDDKILLDGTKTPEGGLLLQLFTENMFGPVFFEIIQRKGNEGFGEGNFQALFEAMERDQIRRGVISGVKE